CRHEIPDENIHSTTLASGNPSRNANGMRMKGIPIHEHCSNKKREIGDLKGTCNETLAQSDINSRTSFKGSYQNNSRIIVRVVLQGMILLALSKGCDFLPGEEVLLLYYSGILEGSIEFLNFYPT
ncbi:hypothetical protein SCHPADRAFT_897447, partial [Schizopora paradoxa]